MTRGTVAAKTQAATNHDGYPLDLPPEDQRQLLQAAIDIGLQHLADVPENPVGPTIVAADLRDRVAAFDLETGTDPQSALAQVAALLSGGTVHTTHPRYFGLFNPTPLSAGIAADILTATFNPQLAAWSHAPAAVEMEARVIKEIGRALGMADVGGSFTTGGAEANATAVLLGLQCAFPDAGHAGLASLQRPPVFYVSTESHLAWFKIAHQCGLGRENVRLVAADDDLRMDVDRLAAMVAADRAQGFAPFLVVATAGTTSAGEIDPLHATADLAEREGLWVHVDAAWAGAAAISPLLRPHLDGIERADSVTVDAHKWFSAPMGAGMLLTRHEHVLGEVFDVTTSYMPSRVPGTLDPYLTSMQWSRRAAGLKLFLSMAVHGRAGHAGQVEADTRRGRRLADELRADGWTMVNQSPLPVVCFQGDMSSAAHQQVVDDVVQAGEAWISTVSLRGQTAIRACVISHRTSDDDLTRLVAALGEARARQLAQD